MHERTGTQEQTHLNDAVEQHVSHTGCVPCRIQQHHTEQHITQVADCRIGKSSLKMSLPQCSSG